MVASEPPALYRMEYSAAFKRRLRELSQVAIARGDGAAFLAAAGASHWHYEMADGSLAIGGTQFGMTPIGSFSPPYQTWLWAWANEDFPEVARAASRRIQGLHAVTGFRVFLDPGINASSEDAQDCVALAVHQFGAIGFFRCPSDVPAL